MSKYDPTKGPLIALEIVRQHFGPGSDAVKVSRLQKENPVLYRQMRQVAIDEGVIYVPKSLKQQHDEIHQAKQPTPAQQEAMKVVSREEVDRLFRGIGQQAGDSNNLANIRKNDPDRFKVLQLAAEGFGVINRPAIEVNDNSHRAQYEKRQQSLNEELADSQSNGEYKFRLADSVAIEAGVPLGTMVTMAQFGRVCSQAGYNKRNAEIAAREAEAAKAKTEKSDKPGEDEEPTAA